MKKWYRFNGWHECKRVFQDRLVSNEDREKFNVMLRQACNDHLKKDWDKVKGITA